MENENKEMSMTPKERYDTEMKNINSAKGVDIDKKEIESLADDTEKIMDELENREDKKELDKNMGVDKKPIGAGTFTMTKEEFNKGKEAKAAQAAVQALRTVTASNLSDTDQKCLDLLVDKHDSEETKDEVLIELLSAKRDMAKTILSAMNVISELQKKLLNEVSTASNNLTEAKGSMKMLDGMILKRCETLKNKDLKKEKMN